MSSFLVLCEGDTKNRWRDGQVCPDVRQGTMAPWARRLGGKKRKVRRGGRKGRERTDGRRRGENGRKRVRERERTVGERAESGIGVKKTMNAGGVENGI
ncbi:hypothetical protein TNCV_169861 [Trichonephila clavipes]|nr:hypothetical protein TNCV_169861 [Trichonephila clavipes]